MKAVAKLVKDFSNGKSLRDSEMLDLTEAYRDLARSCSVMGERFSIVYKEAINTYFQLRSMCQARGLTPPELSLN